MIVFNASLRAIQYKRPLRESVTAMLIRAMIRPGLDELGAACRRNLWRDLGATNLQLSETHANWEDGGARWRTSRLPTRPCTYRRVKLFAVRTEVVTSPSFPVLLIFLGKVPRLHDHRHDRHVATVLVC